MRKPMMSNAETNAAGRSSERDRALSRWASEGGAGPGHRVRAAIPDPAKSPRTQSMIAQSMQLRIRVIALENLLITLLADRPERQLELARDMATYISPRPGFTDHPVTIHAASQMIHLIGRAAHFRPAPA